MAQRSKLCEVNSEQTILGTASGLNLTGCYRYSFKRGNNIFTISAVVGSSLSEPAIEKEEKMKNQDITHTLVDRARDMRKEPTEEENKLWHLYLNKIKPRFTRQKIIGSYIVDFYCPKLKLVIEIDGVQHYLEENIEYEKRREAFLQKEGYKLLRFYNSDINRNLKNTETTIYYTCIERARALGVGVEVTFTED